MAASLAENRIDFPAVLIEQIERDKRLNRSGKAAALKAPCAAPFKNALADGKSKRYPPVLWGF